MKGFIFSTLMLLCLLAMQPEADAQNRYGQTTFALDTITNAEPLNYTLPNSYGDDKLQDMASWQVKLTNLSGTHTIHLIVEESIDEDTSPDYYVRDTIVASHSSASSNVVLYNWHGVIKGKKMRLRVPATGTATTQIEVDAWTREKVPFMLTDEQ